MAYLPPRSAWKRLVRSSKDGTASAVPAAAPVDDGAPGGGGSDSTDAAGAGAGATVLDGAEGGTTNAHTNTASHSSVRQLQTASAHVRQCVAHGGVQESAAQRATRT